MISWLYLIVNQLVKDNVDTSNLALCAVAEVVVPCFYFDVPVFAPIVVHKATDSMVALEHLALISKYKCYKMTQLRNQRNWMETRSKVSALLYPH